MKKALCLLGWVVVVVALAVSRVGAGEPSFSRLKPLPAPKVVAAAEEYPGGNYAAAKLLDGNPDTAYATNGKGTETFVEFDFGGPVRIAAMKYVDRNDPATVAESKLTFLDAAGKAVAAASVRHVNQRAGVTFFPLPEPIAARRVRWQVTKLGSPHSTVGGSEMVFFTSQEPETAPRGIGIEALAIPVVERRPTGQVQPLRVTLDYPYATPVAATVRVAGQEPSPLQLTFGSHTLPYTIPVVASEKPLDVAVDCAGRTVAACAVMLKPPRKTTIYILPHSHTDIGYTEIQTEIEDKQVNNLLRGIEYAKKTAGYPPGSRFVWNVEVLWAADLYLRRLGEPQRAAFLEAVKKGQVALCGMYLNELTGLCRPEELMRLFRFATQLRRETGATLDSAMISDVPGYTWGTVPAMREAGIKYFSVAPNYFDRIGDILVQWENKPFYWVGPSGKDKVLVWIPYKGYAMSHVYRVLTPEFVEHYQAQLDRTGYPYDIAYMRWAGHGDNAVPDPAICEFVKEWAGKYEWPKFVISSTSDAFRALEERYSDKLPRVQGDWTPYWEDGAGSSSLETSMNRDSSDRLAQAEALWAIQGPGTYPAADFGQAWRDVLLYSEHTWGAWCSVSEPTRRETREQWAIKQSYAVAADRESRDLLSRAIGQGQQAADSATIDVFNSTSWARTDLVVVPKYLSEERSRVLDAEGKPLPSQRLRSGELVFLARDVPPFAAMRYRLEEGPAHVEGKVAVSGPRIENGLLSVLLDEKTGAVVDLRAAGLDVNLADTASGHAINQYLYLIGDNPADLKPSGPAKITVREAGPLVASLLVESDAPGCHKLRQEVRLVAGLDRVEFINLVDKSRLVAPSYHAREGKESVNFAFPFRVPDGQVRLEVPFGVFQPDTGQIPSACKNWFTVNRWADVSNADFGVTWVTLDAPLVQVGGVTATLLNSQANPDIWRKQVGPTQKLYSWAMNNHWGTNYRAYQEGPVAFRFVLRPHRKLDAAEASRLAIGMSQPLLAAGARGPRAPGVPRLTIDSPDVLVTGLKPSDDGRAILVRLWGGAGKDVEAKVTWSAPVPRRVSRSDLSEQPRAEVNDTIPVPAWGVVTLRADLP